MSNTTQKLQFLKIKGPLSVAPVRPEDLRGEKLWVHILMGPTGSGKSAISIISPFIESLSPNQDLKISKDSLDSVTQNVTCYQVVNLTDRDEWNHILMDTPGFLDTKLSESRITSMITEQLDGLCQSAATIVVTILYFQPITDIRMGGSKRDAVKLLRAFAESFKAIGINVVTTMWNHLSRPQQIIDGNHRIISLEKEIFVSAKLGLKVHKFEFSRDSALLILDNIHGGWIHHQDTSQKMNDQYQSLICNNLLDRISSTQQHLQFLTEDKQNATTPGKEDPGLLEVVLRDERAVLAALQSFLDDFVTFGPTGLEALESLLDASYVNNPSSCSPPWLQPAILLGKSSIEVQNSPPSPSPSPSPSPNSFSACLKDFVSPLKKNFRKFKQ
ncbi:hypothetical protein BJ165DRAFT_1464666 [Panaeolus papilionaceus]|nr:hypothetical protein BJ165DRAFT_1464666 [Panaeolus papilionaceus]